MHGHSTSRQQLGGGKGERVALRKEQLFLQLLTRTRSLHGNECSSSWAALFQQERGSAIWKFHGEDNQLNVSQNVETTRHVLLWQLSHWKNFISVITGSWNSVCTRKAGQGSWKALGSNWKTHPPSTECLQGSHFTSLSIIISLKTLKHLAPYST